MEFVEKSCKEFVDILASDAPVPGGGGASALVGAIGVALGHMVGSLTIKKQKYSDVWEEFEKLNEKCHNLEGELLNQVGEDAKGFEPLAAAYRIPKEYPARAQVLEEATVKACEAPLKIMELCCEAIDVIEVYAAKGSVLALSDAGCGATICRAALEAAALNIFINTGSMHNREKAEEINGRCMEMLNNYCKKAETIYNNIATGLKNK